MHAFAPLYFNKARRENLCNFVDNFCMEFTVNSVAEWQQAVEKIAPELKHNVLLLKGNLGAGKTTFTQNFIGEGETLSPTYSILSECKNFLHADLYRIEKNEEILQLELPIYLEDKQYFFVEWGMKFSRRLMRELPENYSTYLLEIVTNETAPETSEGH